MSLLLLFSFGDAFTFYLKKRSNKLQGSSQSDVNIFAANNCIKTIQIYFSENDLGDDGSTKIIEVLACCRVVSELSIDFESEQTI